MPRQIDNDLVIVLDDLTDQRIDGFRIDIHKFFDGFFSPQDCQLVTNFGQSAIQKQLVEPVGVFQGFPETATRFDIEGQRRCSKMQIQIEKSRRQIFLISHDPGHIGGDCGSTNTAPHADHNRQTAALRNLLGLGLPVNIDFAANDTSDLADELMRDKYHDATIYTAWSHGYLPELINKVAEEASGKDLKLVKDWTGDDFDSVLVLTLKWNNGKATLQYENYKQNLNDGAVGCPT